MTKDYNEDYLLDMQLEGNESDFSLPEEETNEDQDDE